jgi:probable blue pigment (indigoidine) exporter
VAVVAEGGPPHLGVAEAAAFAFVAVVATALAFVAWFAGLRRLDAGTVGLVGLLNPVTGVLLGALVAGELLTGRQLAGIALVLGGIVVGQRTARRVPGTSMMRLAARRVRMVVAPTRSTGSGAPAANGPLGPVPSVSCRPAGAVSRPGAA